MVFLLFSLPAVPVFHLPFSTQLPGQLQPKSILFSSHLLIHSCSHLVRLLCLFSQQELSGVSGDAAELSLGSEGAAKRIQISTFDVP